MQRSPEGTGWIEVICGSMFSGKTEELISRLRREVYARKSVQVFKPRTDDRYAVDAVVSHSDLSMPCVAVATAREIIGHLDPEATVVGIDEAQFFGGELVDVVGELADRGLRVVCAGLDQDYLGQPFEPMPQLLALAEFITKKLAVCVRCGNPANRSQRMSAREQRVVVGAHDSYEARCRRCHTANAIAAPAQEPLPMPVNGTPRPPVPEQAPLPIRELI
jgi:thymidine kinase